jgi:hypothetical protein
MAPGGDARRGACLPLPRRTTSRIHSPGLLARTRPLGVRFAGSAQARSHEDSRISEAGQQRPSRSRDVTSLDAWLEVPPNQRDQHVAVADPVGVSKSVSRHRPASFAAVAERGRDLWTSPTPYRAVRAEQTTGAAEPPFSPASPFSSCREAMRSRGGVSPPIRRWSALGNSGRRSSRWQRRQFPEELRSENRQ